MKHFLPSLLLVCLGFSSVDAQIYEEAFQRYEITTAATVGQYHSDPTHPSNQDYNWRGDLAWGASYHMYSFIEMYRATDDPGYLDRVLTNIFGVLDQRDMVTGTTDYRGISGPVWSADRDAYLNGLYDGVQDGQNGYAFVVHTGMITYPMAEWARLVKADAALQALNYTGSYTLPSGVSANFDDIADYLIQEVEDAIAYHDDMWTEEGSDPLYPFYFLNTSYAAEGHSVANTGFYFDRPSAVAAGLWEQSAQFSDGMFIRLIIPANRRHAMARTLLSMYLVTGNLDYRNKAERMARLHQRTMDEYDGRGHVTWPYSIYYDIDSREDVSHASISAEFAYQCWENGIVYTTADMQDIAEMVRNTQENPLYFYNLIGNDGSGNPPNSNLGEVGQIPRYMMFSQFDPDLYQMVGDPVFDPTVDIGLNPIIPASHAGTTMIALARMCRLRRRLEPANVSRVPGENSNWAGTAGGDYLGLGEDNQFVSVRNFDANFYLYKASDGTNGSITNHGSITGYGVNSNWAGITRADLDGNGIDEFVALRNFDGNIYGMGFNSGGSPYAVFNHTGFGANSQWAGIAGGDFNGDSRDEFVCVRNFDGNFFIMGINTSNTLYTLDAITAPGANSEWADVAAGDFDGDGRDEFIAMRNYDGNFYMYKFDDNTGEFATIASFTAPGPDSDWTGITAGDFDGDGADEWLAHRNYDGDFLAFELVNGAIQFVHREYVPYNQLNGVLSSIQRDEDNDKMQLVSHRGFDADMFVWNLHIEDIANICDDVDIHLHDIYTPSLKHYHANEELLAGPAVFVEAPDEVTFRAGSFISLLPGFSATAGSNFTASIDPDLDCVPTVKSLPLAPPKPKPTPIVSTTPTQTAPVAQIGVYPNPSRGRYQLSYISEDLSTGQFSVYDQTGREIANGNLSSGINATIDLSSEAPGLYLLVVHSGENVWQERLVKY